MRKRKTDESWRKGLGDLKEKNVYWHVGLCNTMNIHDIFFQLMNISMDNTMIFLIMKKK